MESVFWKHEMLPIRWFFILSMVILRAEDLGLRTMQTAMKFIVKRFKAAERVVLCQLTRCYFWTNT